MDTIIMILSVTAAFLSLVATPIRIRLALKNLKLSGLMCIFTLISRERKKHKGVQFRTTYEVLIKNCGSVPLMRDDFISPVKLICIEGNTIHTQPQITRRKPEDLEVEAKLSDTSNNQFEIYPNLLNPKDEIVIELIQDGNNDSPLLVKGRIKGVSHDSIRNWEGDRFLPNRKSQEKLAKIFGLNAGTLSEFVVECL